jgi:lipopolysaccharide transport system permease protein
MHLGTAALASHVYVRDASKPQRLELALADLRTGLLHWRLATALARLDIRNRYRGSVLGPFWLTLSTAAMIAGLGVLYSSLFRLSLQQYLPFLTVSLLIWNTINQIVTEGCGVFTASEGIIRQLPLPYTVHVLRCVFRNAAVAAHNLPIILVVFFATSSLPGAEALLVLPGIVLLALTAFAGTFLLGMISARFRDIQPIVGSVIQLAFFLSPVLWKPELLGPNMVWLPLNPFYALMETVRGPLVDGGAAPIVWLAAVGYTALVCGAAFMLFVRFRSRITFWV